MKVSNELTRVIRGLLKGEVIVYKRLEDEGDNGRERKRKERTKNAYNS